MRKLLPLLLPLLAGSAFAQALAPVEAPLARLAAPDPAAVRSLPDLGAKLLDLNAPVDARVKAAISLGHVHNWRAAGYLKQAISDPSREVRFACALALGKTRDVDGLPFLIRALASDQDWWVRFAAAVALGEDKDPRAVAALGLSASSEKEWQVRMQAVRSLGQIGSRDAAYALEKPLADRDPGVRAAAALALRDIGGLDSLNLLSAALKTETAEFPRQVMASAIKRLNARP